MKTMTRRHLLGPILLLAGWLSMTASAVAANAETETKVEYEAGFYYTVKKGDTLWDLSQRFSDSPWQWPDLWSENKQLTNPHWIYPGERIRLYRKSESSRHKVEKTTTPMSEVPVLTPQVEASALQEQTKPEVDFLFPNIDCVGFIRNPVVAPLGTIFKSMSDKLLISRGDSVYIRYPDSQKSDEIQPGARMTVYRTIDPEAKDTSNRSSGSQHYLLGVAEVVTIEPEYAIARIIESYRAIRLEDKVMPYQPRSPAIRVVESAPDINAHIIVAEDHNLLMGDHMLAFIDKGTDDQIQPGQIYGIYQQETAKVGSKSGVILNPAEIGLLVVVHTEKDNSTVFITKSKDRIAPGQLVLNP